MVAHNRWKYHYKITQAENSNNNWANYNKHQDTGQYFNVFSFGEATVQNAQSVYNSIQETTEVNHSDWMHNIDTSYWHSADLIYHQR